MAGNNVSKAHNKTRRVQRPNLQRKRTYLQVSLQYVPTAILSRQTAGVRGGTLIVNLPVGRAPSASVWTRCSRRCPTQTDFNSFLPNHDTLF